jgi:hypothetical protein
MASRYEIDFSLWPEGARPRRNGAWRKLVAVIVAVSAGLTAAAAMVLSGISLSPTSPAVNTAMAGVVSSVPPPAPPAVDPSPPHVQTAKPLMRNASPRTAKSNGDPSSPETVGRVAVREPPAQPAQNTNTISAAQLHRQAIAKAETVEPNLKGSVQAEPEPAAEKKPAQVRKRPAGTTARRKDEYADPNSRVYLLPDGRRVIMQDRWVDRRSYARGDFYRGYHRPTPPAPAGRPYGRPY